MLALRRSTHIGLLLIITLVLASCLTPTRPKVVKIGLVAPFEGHYRYIGYDAIYAARLALREINAQDSLDGWHVELVAYDDRGSVELARNAAANLIIDPDVMAVIGHYRSESGQAAASLYAEAGLPFIALGDSGAIDSSWHLEPEPAVLAQAIVEVGTTLDPETAVVLGQDPVADAVRDALEIGGVRAPSEISQRDPNVAFDLLAPIEAAEQASQWRAEGWEGHLVGGVSLSSPAFIRIGGESAQGAFFVTSFPFPRDVAGSQDWIAAYQAVGPHVPEPGPYALPTYEAIHLVINALDRALTSRDEVNRSAVTGALVTAERIGRLGEIAWESSGHWNAAPLYLYQWTGQAPRLIGQVP
ncbi:MAG: branched-chain amino acid ABC transporter substrate-binding protein [Anaerolineae bacterium]